MVDLGYVNRVTDQLKLRTPEVPYQLFCDVEPDPSIQTVLKGVQLMRSFEPDTIIALGGGSAMDAAKGMWLFYEHPEVNFNDLKQKFMDIRKRAFKYPELGKKAKLVCIPTTSGTGSETTLAAVISNPETKEKFPIEDPHITPKYTILNPKLLVKLPPHITSTTGMDALTHAVEAYIGKANTKKTKQKALNAVKLTFKNLQNSYEQPNNLIYRENMQVAAFDAGVAFTRAYVGYVHAIAHSLGGKYNTPHGLANAILLPTLIGITSYFHYITKKLLCKKKIT